MSIFRPGLIDVLSLLQTEGMNSATVCRHRGKHASNPNTRNILRDMEQYGLVEARYSGRYNQTVYHITDKGLAILYFAKAMEGEE